MTRAAALRAARELRKWSTGPICVSKYGHTAHRSNVPYGWGFEVSPSDIRHCGLISVCASTRDARRRMHTYRLLDPESKFYMRTRRLPIECGQAIDDHIALSSKASD